MESQRLGEVFNSLSANINVRSKKHYLQIFVVLTFILFFLQKCLRKGCPVGLCMWVIHVFLLRFLRLHMLQKISFKISTKDNCGAGGLG